MIFTLTVTDETVQEKCIMLLEVAKNKFILPLSDLTFTGPFWRMCTNKSPGMNGKRKLLRYGYAKSDEVTRLLHYL